ncbi:hypothetical protein RI129_005132 [Pyrocoelia pectoralis]|uniref:Uncharacterized protein n=1 Tax=Pyrocoelia pectoralis TaxID=417401 RepID=A0AAN7VK63_9COLE
MEVAKLLCDSNFCRLCAQENKNSTSLFPHNENEQDLSQLVNKYLPLKVERDGKYPMLICPGCNIQLEATKQFLDLIVEGQIKLRDLFRLQQDTLRRQEKQRQQLESALKNVNPSSSVETYTIQADETGEKFVIQIFSEGPLFPAEHEMSLKAEGLERPKRKRGRPPKPPQPTNAVIEEEQKDPLEQEIEENADDLENRRKRKIKVPSRFQEALQGKELDRIFKEEGVLGDESLSDDETHSEAKFTNKAGDEIIGHLQNKEGEDLGELVIVNRSTNKVRIKAKDETESDKKKYECKICGREFQHYGRYEMHKNFHRNIKYQCCAADCNLKDSSKSVIEEHQKETGHSGIVFFECIDNYGAKVHIHVPDDDTDINEVDEERNVKENEPQKSSRVTDTEVKFVCNLCNKTFSCKQNFEIHLKAVHENQRPYQCDKCEKSFPYINSLKCHMCVKKIFNHPSSLVYHREAEHNNGRRFVCNKCNKSFKHKQLLQRHQLVHSNERPHTCKLCNASFKTRANLLNHMPIHTGEKKYYCTQCGQTFAHKTSLTLHMRWHSGQKPYEFCLLGEKPFCCDHCGRKFTTSSQFKLHIKRHTGERPWRCEYCSKTFLHKDTWKCHTRRHRNERPYQCKQCLRGFTEQWALKKHERLHTGEKPYVCEICHKGFADCSNLTKHKKIHTNIKGEKGSSKPKNIKIELIDEDSSTINLTTSDGEQVKVLATMEDGQQVLQGLLPNGTFVPITLTIQNGKPVASIPSNGVSDPSTVLENSIQFLNNDDENKLDNNIQFVTEDGQNICFVATYNLEESINPHYLAMT